MARYEYRCKVCDERFELRRSMSQADDPATCPSGHADVARLLSVFASVGASAPAASSGRAAPMGGGCGGACACSPG